jgi:hypothetical protein
MMPWCRDLSDGGGRMSRLLTILELEEGVKWSLFGEWNGAIRERLTGRPRLSTTNWLNMQLLYRLQSICFL